MSGVREKKNKKHERVGAVRKMGKQRVFFFSPNGKNRMHKKIEGCKQ